MWTRFLNWIDQVSSWFMVIVMIVALLASLILISTKVKRRGVTIILTAASCVFFTVLIVTSIYSLLDANLTGAALAEKQQEIEINQIRLENEELFRSNLELTSDNLNKDARIKKLDEEIELLTHTQISMSSLNKICELALLEVPVEETDVRKKLLDIDDGFFATLFADRVEKEVLVVTTHDLNAKFGVSLADVFIWEENDNQLKISGIKSKYIGADKNIADIKISEIRDIKYKNDIESDVKVLNDRDSIRRANNYALDFSREFQTRLSEGLECAYLDEAVVKLSQNFISVILAPLGKEIVFEEKPSSSGVPILEYLNEEIRIKQEEKKQIEASKNRVN